MAKNQHPGIGATELAARDEFRALCAERPQRSDAEKAVAMAAHGVATTEATVRRARVRLGVGSAAETNVGEAAAPRSMADTIADDRQRRRERIDSGDYRKRYEYTLERLEESEQRLALAAALQDSPEIIRIPRNESLGKNEGCALWLWSDWHIEERVDRARVNGHNEYNPDIAEARVKKLVANSVAMTKIARQDIHIDTLVLWLGGDFINGFIHDELIESNFMSPTEATLFAYQLLVSAIQHTIDHGRFKRIVAPCNFGNHGRIGQKKKIATGFKNSYEWMMYHMLRRHFAGCDAIEFIIPESSYAYVEIFDRTIRTFHGDEIGYGGGIGGVTIPLIKKVHRLDTQRRADMNILGHFHQMCYPTRNTTMNGSLVGFSPYAEWLGCTPEPPMQGFRLLDAKRGFTITAPIFCE